MCSSKRFLLFNKYKAGFYRAGDSSFDDKFSNT